MTEKPENDAQAPDSPDTSRTEQPHGLDAPEAPEVPQAPEADEALQAPAAPEQPIAPRTTDAAQQAQEIPSNLGAGAAFSAAPPAPGQDTSQAAPSKRRAGILVAGIAIGALVGGVAGAGVTALTISSLTGQSAESYTREALTISNPDEATLVSAIAAKATPSVVTLEVSTNNAAGSGSGVIIDPDGYILTNNHVVTLDSGAQDATIRVFLSDGRILPGELIGTDPYADLAVVKVDASGLQALKFADSAKLNVGDLTVAIGAPLNLSSTVTTGVISALYRGITVGTAALPDGPTDQAPTDPGDLWNFDFENQQQSRTASGSITIPVIQTDASINPGNSGGALLDAQGDLIGINVAIASTASASETAGSVGLGFAVPSNLAKRVAEALIAGEPVSHGLLGVSVGDAAGEAGASQSGALVLEVTRGGPASKAGIQKGDVIVSIEGIPVTDGTALSGLVRYFPAGTDVKLEYIRDGKVQTTTATLGEL